MAGESVRASAGDEATALVLATLPAIEWRVFHDVRWPGRRSATLDHVLVGPQGVFVVDSQTWSGEIDVQSGVLRQNGRRRGEVVEEARAAAAAVSELVLGVDPGLAKPVVCFVRPEPVFGWVDEVLVCSTQNVATLLTSRPRVFDENVTRDAAALLARGLPSANAPAAPHARSPRKPRRPGPPPGLIRSVVSIILLGVVAVLGFTVVVPTVIHAAEDSARDTLSPTAALGTTLTVQGNPLRPQLELTVDSVRPTRALGAAAPTDPGHRLWAAHVSIHNSGDQAWRSDATTTFAVADQSDHAHARSTSISRVQAGRQLPGVIKVPPGSSRAGVVVFDVSRAAMLDAVELTVGPGLPRTVRWTVGGEP